MNSRYNLIFLIICILITLKFNLSSHKRIHYSENCVPNSEDLAQISNKMTDSVVDTLLLDCSCLFEELSTISETNKQEEAILQHILQCKNKDLQIGDFKQGQEWFGVSEALSLHKQLKGKVVVLDFFTYCCINCMHILPDLKQLEKDFSIEDGLVIVGVHSAKFDNEKDSANILAAMQRYGITHPVVNDAEGDLWNRLGIPCWPTLLILGPSGEALFLLMGEGHRERLTLLIRTTLQYYKKEGELLSHKLPVASDLHLAPSILRFPGKVTFCSTQNNRDTSGNNTQDNLSPNDRLAIADTGHHRIIILTATGKVEFLVGRDESGFIDGSLSEARFSSPQGIVFRNPDILYVADTENHAIREINLKTRFVRTLVGSGIQGFDYAGGALWTKQMISSPWDLCLMSSSQDTCCEKDILLIAMAGTHQIWALFLKDVSWWKGKTYAAGTCVAIVGSGKEENRNNSYPHAAAFAQPSGLSIAPSLQNLFVADSESSSIRRVSLVDGKVSAVVGGDRSPSNLFQFGDHDGKQYDARLQHPLGVAWCERNKTLYVADSYNHKLKAVDVSANTCTTVFGTGKPGNAVGSFVSPLDVQLNEPGGLCINEAGDVVYVADTNNHCIKVVHLERKSIEELTIVLPPEHEVDSRNSRIIPVIHTEVPINSAGGTLKLSISVSLDDKVTLTEGALQKWSLVLPDDTWSANINGGDYIPETLLNISVPKANNGEAAKLFVSYRLFVCYHHSACTLQNLQFAVTMKYNTTSPKEVSHCISHIIDTKGLRSSI